MQPHVGMKVVNAAPMTRGEYNTLRGWAVPVDENPNDPGFLVEYVDGGAANTPHFTGYVSWSPKDVFERAYRPVSGLTFGMAVDQLKKGKRVARAGWNGKGMFLVLVPGSQNLTVDEGRPLAKAGVPVGTKFNYLPHIDMFTVQGDFVPWLASQTDVLAEDWQLVD
jgi:hypothetical protein